MRCGSCRCELGLQELCWLFCEAGWNTLLKRIDFGKDIQFLPGRSVGYSSETFTRIEHVEKNHLCSFCLLCVQKCGIIEDELQLSTRISFRWGPVKSLRLVWASAYMTLSFVSASISWVQSKMLLDKTHGVYATEVSTSRILAFGLLARLGDNISRKSLLVSLPRCRITSSFPRSTCMARRRC